MKRKNYSNFYKNRCVITLIPPIEQDARCVGYTNSSNINYKTYIERLVYFKLESLELRRLKIDLTTIFKISNNYIDINISDILNI